MASGAAGSFRPAWAAVDLGALGRNVATLCEVVRPAALCAVVKADGYGHGAAPVASAALAAGASCLAVALVEEAIELREAGIAQPVLLLSEPPADALDAAVAAGVTLTVYTPETILRLGAAARRAATTVSVHLKVDTGMHRVGAAPAALVALAAAVDEEAGLGLEGVWTHLAVADGAGDDDRDYTRAQLDRFDDARSRLGGSRTPGLVLHAANSAGAIAWPRARYDLVRCGIALYGPSPGPAATAALADLGIGRLEPVLSLRARVVAVRTLGAGERPSYGRLRPLPEESVVATVPLGYADGVPRALFDGGFEVLVGGRRCPLAGMVTMDQILVDCGPNATVTVGDEVVLLGSQGDEEITADEWASRLGTISYEVLCGVGPRVPRRYTGPPPPG